MPTNENYFNNLHFITEPAQWGKHRFVAPHGWLLHVVVSSPATAATPAPAPAAACLLLDFGLLVGNGCWQRHKVDNKYLQETMSPLISVKKLSNRPLAAGWGLQNS